MSDNHLRELRVRQGMSQKDLARRVGTSSQDISNLETGRKSMQNVTVRKALKFAQALNCAVEDLV